MTLEQIEALRRLHTERDGVLERLELLDVERRIRAAGGTI